MRPFYRKRGRPVASPSRNVAPHKIVANELHKMPVLSDNKQSAGLENSKPAPNGPSSLRNLAMKLHNNLLLKKIMSEICGQPLRLVRASWRVQGATAHPEAESLLAQGKPVIYALWHGRMYCLFKAVPLDKVAILVSPSNDGEFITRIARRIGFRHFVRGSHKRGGTQAILGLHHALCEAGQSIAFTVDGPRGPRYKVKSGIIRLASQTGAPIVPLGSATQWLLHKFDRSWDHFHAPLPFTTMQLAYGEPLSVPPELSDEDIQTYTACLEAELMRVNLAVDALYGFQKEERL
jgi:lysophospholipid acyltransferase (LPLAT)-like uncharacterized protein